MPFCWRAAAPGGWKGRRTSRGAPRGLHADPGRARGAGDRLLGRRSRSGASRPRPRMIVVPDAGPLIYLAGAGQLDLLRRLYVEVGMALMTPGALVSSHSARIAARYSPVKVLRRGRATSVSEGFGVLVAVLNMVRSSDALLRSSGGCQCLTHVDIQGSRAPRRTPPASPRTTMPVPGSSGQAEPPWRA